MQLQILGTAAAEGWPGLFCNCEACIRARKLGGKDIRSRASMQIDDVFKIDFPPDTYYHSIRWGLELHRLKYLFFTHSHEDHFAVNQLGYLWPPYAHNLENDTIKVYGNETVLSAIRDRFYDKIPAELIYAKPFSPIKADHLTFTPVKARHKPDEESLNYIIQSDTATVLYASDTGIYEQETMDFLKNYQFDLLIMECTHGNKEDPYRYHMGFGAVLELRDSINKGGAIKPSAKTVITHFSHNGSLSHAEFEALANPEGIEVAYDGIVLEV